MKNTIRITYNALCRLIDQWNKDNGLKYRDYGFLMVDNDSSVYWLTQISKQDETSTKICDVMTDGSVRSCYYAVRYVKAPTKSA